MTYISMHTVQLPFDVRTVSALSVLGKKALLQVALGFVHALASSISVFGGAFIFLALFEIVQLKLC